MVVIIIIIIIIIIVINPDNAPEHIILMETDIT